jgi:hypothetical protein
MLIKRDVLLWQDVAGKNLLASQISNAPLRLDLGSCLWLALSPGPWRSSGWFLEWPSETPNLVASASNKVHAIAQPEGSRKW